MKDRDSSKFNGFPTNQIFLPEGVPNSQIHAYQFFEMTIIYYHHCLTFLSLNVQIMVEVGGF